MKSADVLHILDPRAFRPVVHTAWPGEYELAAKNSQILQPGQEVQQLPFKQRCVFSHRFLYHIVKSYHQQTYSLMNSELNYLIYKLEVS